MGFGGAHKASLLPEFLERADGQEETFACGVATGTVHAPINSHPGSFIQPLRSSLSCWKERINERNKEDMTVEGRPVGKISKSWRDKRG